MRFNLEWENPKATRQSPPRRPQSTTETPPPRETGNSSFGRSANQKPAHPESAVRKRTGRGPSLRHVTELDLVDPRRTLELHRQAALAGLVGSSEADRLKVLALAAHARTHAKRNAPGLFVSALREQRWYLSLRDEDCARRDLRTLRHEDDVPLSTTRLRHGSVEDASVVRALIARSLASVGDSRIAR